MNRLILVRRTFALAVLTCSLAPALNAQQRVEGQLWVGVVLPSGVMMPVAATFGGEWWDGWREKARDVTDVPKSVEEIPPDWLPEGYALPHSWRVLLTDGRTESVVVTRPVKTDDVLDDAVALAVDRRLKVEHPSDIDLTSVIGIALAGSAELRTATDLPKRQADSIVRRLENDFLAAEQYALNAAGSDGAGILAALSTRTRRKTRLDDITARTLRESNGTVLHYVEGAKRYRRLTWCAPQTRFAAVVAEGPHRRLGVVWTAAKTGCEGLAISIAHVPLAAIERNGQTCWVVQRWYEDGAEFYVLDPRSRFEDYTLQRCGIY